MAAIDKTGRGAIESLKKGDIQGAKDAVVGVQEIVNGAGEKVREYSGMKAFEKILEPLKTEGLAGIFAVLQNFFKFISGGFKFSEKLDEAKQKAEGAKDAIKGAAGK